MATEEALDPHETGRDYLLDRAQDDNVANVLHDIINCKLKSVVREITNDDIRYLSQYVRFHQKKNEEIDYPRARNQIEQLLLDYPAFRSCNSDIVCLNIAKYYASHATATNTRVLSPRWVRQAQSSSSSSASNSPNRNPPGNRNPQQNPHRPLAFSPYDGPPLE